MTPSRRRWLAAFTVLLLLVAAAVYWFDWNMLRGPIAERVERATGRTFAINGDLDVRLSLHPRITAQGLVLGNAPWAREPSMVEVATADFTLDALALLRGRVVLGDVKLSEARVFLERNAAGEANWALGKGDGEPPHIGSLTLDRAHVAFRDPTLKTDVAVDASTQPDGLLQVTGRGLVKGLKATVDGTVGSVLALTSADKPYPVKVRAALGATRARIDGALLDPLRLKGEDLGFVLEGGDMAQLFTILGVPLPPTPPYKLSGHLTHEGNLWTFRKFAGRVGGSDLSGDFSVDRGRKPQLITADLTSRNLDMKDLGGFIGADRGESKASPKPPPAGKVLPQEPFSLEKLRVADADVKFRGERVVTEKLPLDKMTAALKLRDGVLSLEPLNFGVAGGSVVSTIRMDARESAIRTHADIGVRQVRLEKLFPGFKLSQANAGLLTGRAKLDTTGNSIARMLAGADGEAALMMEGGSVSELLVRLTDLDLANSLALLLTRDRQVPVRCMVARLEGKGGKFHADPLVLDTGKAVITGSGEVNFADESLDLQLRSRSKGFSLAALQGPINVTGTFAKPNVRPDVPRAVGRGAAAVALGIATGGIGAILPLLDFGGAKDSDCAALITQAAGK